MKNGIIDENEIAARRARMGDPENTRERDEAEFAIVDAIVSLAAKYGALEEFLSSGDVSIPSMMALVNRFGVSSEDFQKCCNTIQVYVYQLEAVSRLSWAECWDGLKSRFPEIANKAVNKED